MQGKLALNTPPPPPPSPHFFRKCGLNGGFWVIDHLPLPEVEQRHAFFMFFMRSHREGIFICPYSHNLHVSWRSPDTPFGLKLTAFSSNGNYDEGDTTSVYVWVLHNHAQLHAIDHFIDQIHLLHTCPGACRREEIEGQSRNISLYAENINWKLIMQHFFFLWMTLKTFKILWFYAF